MIISIYLISKVRQKFPITPDKRLRKKILVEKLSTMSFPSKEYHNRLASLDEDSFREGNLKHVPISKNVLKQCSYEYRKSKVADDSVINSLKILQTRYKDELSLKVAPGFIQFISISPFGIRKDWPRKKWPRKNWPRKNWPRKIWPRKNWPRKNWPRKNWLRKIYPKFAKFVQIKSKQADGKKGKSYVMKNTFIVTINNSFGRISLSHDFNPGHTLMHRLC